MMNLSNYIAGNQYRYYYEQLKNADKALYNQILSGFMTFQESLMLGTGDIDRVLDVYHKICYDVPEVFFVKKLKYRPGANIELLAEYRFTPEECCSIFEVMDEKCRKLRDLTVGMGDVEKVKAAHDYLVRHVSYQDVGAPYSHEAAGPLVYDIGVCEGISKAFKYIADRIGLKSVVVSGMATGEGNPNGGGHAWNVVEVDGKLYHLDVTFDSGLSKNGAERYDYFLLSAEEISADHCEDPGQPMCPYVYNYYATVGRLAGGKRDVVKLVSGMKSGESVVFQMPQIPAPEEEIVSAVWKAVQDAFPQSEYKMLMYHNKERRVFQLNKE